MIDLYKKVAGTDFPAHKKYMEIEVSGDLDDGTDTVMPTVVIKLKWYLNLYQFKNILLILYIIIIMNT